MTSYVLSPKAQTDIESIWDYRHRTWGRARAERYVRQLWDGIQHVAADPRRARLQSDS